MSDLTPEQIIEKARFNALTPSQKGLETKAKKAKATKAPEVKAPEVKAPEVKAVKVKDGFLNPFTEGVTYADFVTSIPNGKTVAEHLNGKFSEDEISWICEEVKHFEKSKKNN